MSGFPECTCDYVQVWHYIGPLRAMQEQDPVVSHYHEDCPVPAHTTLATIISNHLRQGEQAVQANQ